jgi:hypothetical protein
MSVGTLNTGESWQDLLTRLASGATPHGYMATNLGRRAQRAAGSANGLETALRRADEMGDAVTARGQPGNQEHPRPEVADPADGLRCVTSGCARCARTAPTRSWTTLRTASGPQGYRKV